MNDVVTAPASRHPKPRKRARAVDLHARQLPAHDAGPKAARLRDRRLDGPHPRPRHHCRSTSSSTTWTSAIGSSRCGSCTSAP